MEPRPESREFSARHSQSPKPAPKLVLQAPSILPLALASILAIVASFAWTPAARGDVEIPYTLGRLVNESTNVLLMQVEKVDQTNSLILFRQVKDVKGTHPQEVIRPKPSCGWQSRTADERCRSSLLT